MMLSNSKNNTKMIDIDDFMCQNPLHEKCLLCIDCSSCETCKKIEKQIEQIYRRTSFLTICFGRYALTWMEYYGTHKYQSVSK